MSVLIEILGFSTKWSAPCRQIELILGELEKERSDVKVIRVDVEDPKSVGIVEKYEIRAVPTLVFRSRGKTIHRLTGLRKDTKGAIIEVLQLIRDKKLPDSKLDKMRAKMVAELKPLATETPVGQLIGLICRITYEAKTPEELGGFVKDVLVYIDENTEQLRRLRETLKNYSST